MNAVYILTVTQTKQQVVVRAQCMSCARNLAANAAGGEGPMVWRDPALSTIELVRPTDKAGVILRGALL